MALYTCTKCGKKVPWEYEVCPFCQTPRPNLKKTEKDAEKKKEKKHPIFAAITTILVVLAIGSVIGGGDRKGEDTSNGHSESDQSVITQDSTSFPNVSSSADTNNPNSSEPLNSPGPCTLPSGFEITLFYSSVRNDVTGNWELSAGASSIPISDHALEYYNAMFTSDDEIHAVWNATLGTMTSIKAMSGLLVVDTFEYVDGEEHDAKLLFSGMLLDSQMIDIDTGEPWEG